MDVFDVKTKKDLFLLKLRNEPIILDVSNEGGDILWATKEQLDRLWDLGVLQRIENGKALVTHHLISIVPAMDNRIDHDHTPAGTVLGR